MHRLLARGVHPTIISDSLALACDEACKLTETFRISGQHQRPRTVDKRGDDEFREQSGCAVFGRVGTDRGGLRGKILMKVDQI